MGNCNSTCTPGVGSELSLDQPEEKLLNKNDKQRFHAITSSVMYSMHVCMVIIYRRVWINRVRLPILLGVS